MNIQNKLIQVGDVLSVFYIDDNLKKRRVSGICFDIHGRGGSRTLELLIGGEARTRLFIRSPLVVSIQRLRVLDRVELDI